MHKFIIKIANSLWFTSIGVFVVLPVIIIFNENRFVYWYLVVMVGLDAILNFLTALLNKLEGRNNGTKYEI